MRMSQKARLFDLLIGLASVHYDQETDEWELVAFDYDGDEGQRIVGKTLQEAAEEMDGFYRAIPSRDDQPVEVCKAAYDNWLKDYHTRHPERRPVNAGFFDPIR